MGSARRQKKSPFKLSEDDFLSLNVYLYQSQSCVTAENSDLVAIYVFFMERNRSCKSGPGNPQGSANNCDFWGTKKKSRFVLLEVIHDSPCQIEKQYVTVLDSLLPNLSLTSPIMFSF